MDRNKKGSNFSSIPRPSGIFLEGSQIVSASVMPASLCSSNPGEGPLWCS